MRHARTAFLTSCLSLSTLALAWGCGGTVPAEPGPGGGGAGGGATGTGGGGTGGSGGGVPGDCTTVVSPSADDTMTLQTAFINAESGDVICLAAGTYKPKAELSLNKTGVTIKGIGATRDDVVLDFIEQTVDDDSMQVTSDGFTIEKLTIKNSPNNGIVVSGAEDVVFRDLKVSWDAGSVETNGAYAVYPVGCRKVLVEDCEVTGAADAGIYVGQSDQIIVRNNVVWGNVAGIEIENSTLSEVHNNDAYDNTAGILVFVLPNLEKKDGVTCSVHDNIIRENNRDNFAASGVVGSVPRGIGVLVLAADDTEIRNNTIRDNNSTGIVVVAHSTLEQLDAEFMSNDPMTDGFPEKTYIHDNTFENNGTDPAQVLLALGYPTLPDILWDGCENPPTMPELCLGMTAPMTFLETGCNLTMQNQHSTDPTPFLCDLPTQPPVSLE
jgi:parallel beta-helix repeat protein